MKSLSHMTIVFSRRLKLPGKFIKHFVFAFKNIAKLWWFSGFKQAWGRPWIFCADALVLIVAFKILATTWPLWPLVKASQRTPSFRLAESDDTCSLSIELFFSSVANHKSVVTYSLLQQHTGPFWNYRVLDRLYHWNWTLKIDHFFDQCAENYLMNGGAALESRCRQTLLWCFLSQFREFFWHLGGLRPWAE